MATTDDAVLDIRDLCVTYTQNGVSRRALRDVSLAIPSGQVCGLVGESGSGKTTLALAAMRYLPTEGALCGGSIRFRGRELMAFSRRDMESVWGRELALVPQDPLSSLNPSIRLGEQLGEILRRHLSLSRSEARRRTLELYASVRLADPERVADSYPYQMSGGMLQRALIAMAISTEPHLLILDEPTSSLDVTTQAVVLDLLRDLTRDRRTAVLHISHNLGTVAQLCDRVVVLYAGETMEDAPSGPLYELPLHPYTQGLLDCVPRLGQTRAQVVLRPIRGRIPSLDRLPEGCIFRPRCPLAIPVCFRHPPLYDAGPGRGSRCHRWDEVARGELGAHQPAPSIEPSPAAAAGEGVLCAVDLRVHFREGRSLAGLLRGRAGRSIKAVDGVGFCVEGGHTVGLVGESGSGKTTIAQALVGLAERTGGDILLQGERLAPRLRSRPRETRRRLQIVFQNPEEALNPYMSVGEALRRPLIRLMGRTRAEADDEVRGLLRAVGMDDGYASRLPAQLSGGEKQRVALARAFAPNPEVLIADEPVSSLDVSVQASILNLLAALQQEHGSSTLFISHDLVVVGYLSDVVLVLYLGRVMEESPAAAVFDPPYHPYTEALLSSIPLIDPGAHQERIRLSGEVPSPAETISGCPFHTRCPRFLGRICVEEVPPWRTHAETRKRYFCHIPVEELIAVQRRPFAFHDEAGEG